MFNCVFNIVKFLDKLYGSEVSSKTLGNQEWLFLRISILNSELRYLFGLWKIYYLFFDSLMTEKQTSCPLNVSTSTIWTIIIRCSTTKTSWTTSWSSEVVLISFTEFIIIKVDASPCICSSFTSALCDVIFF